MTGETMLVSNDNPLQHTPRVISKVSLICTLYNERKSINSFLDSIYSMSSLPEEFIIVDGGSTDGTSDIISEYIGKKQSGMNVRHIIDETCNRQHMASPVSHGRNIAIANARNEIIACTDAGCKVEKDWLSKIVDPLLADIDIHVVGGWYLPEGELFFQRVVASFWISPGESVRADTMLPSSRSIAFRREAWRTVGGYPEEYITAEDTAFALNLRKAKLRFVAIPDAVVYWRMPTNLANFVTLVFRYATGDGFCSLLPLNPWKNLGKICITLITAALTFIVSPYFFIIFMLWVWILLFWKRPLRSLRVNDIILLPLFIILKTISDATYIFGYIAGFISLKRSI
jgi:cellulose synthase/poly-beta-1,6-N-acetylglucosamine synthase-like glycosyltransferase